MNRTIKNIILKTLILICLLTQGFRLYAQGTVDLVAGHVTTLSYTYATNVQAVYWEISDYSVVKLNTTGTYTVAAVIEGVGEGTATVKATYYCWNWDYSKIISGEVIWTVNVSLPDPLVMSLLGDSVTVHRSKYLQVSVYPELAKRDFTWESSDNSVLLVDDEGRISGVNVGTADITVRTHNGLSSTKSIKVHPVYVEAIDIIGANTLLCGRPQQLQVFVAPEDVTYRELKWSSSDETVALVENGMVYPLQCGEVEITATALDEHNVSAKHVVQINPVLTERIELSQASSEVIKYDSLLLNATIYPEDVTYNEIKWKSSDNSVAIVNDGLVVAKKPGVATITATTVDGMNATCDVTVLGYDYSATISTDAIAVNSQSIATEAVIPLNVDCNFPATNIQFDVYLPDGFSLSAVTGGNLLSDSHHVTFSEVNASHYRILCSSEQNIAFTARSGVVALLRLEVNPGIASGDKTICIKRAYMSDIDTPSTLFLLQDVEITVSVSTLAEQILIEGAVDYVNIGDTIELTAKIYPANTTIKNVDWLSSDENIATVKDGIVTAVSEGSVEIKVTISDGSSLEAIHKITVVNPENLLPVAINVNSNAKVVTITGTMTGSNIHYTLDGSNPTAESSLYLEPFTINRNLTIKAIEIWPGGFVVSPTATFNIDIFNVANPVITHEGNNLMISCETEDATIYYTTDGTEPTAGSSLYTLPVTIDSNCTIKAIAFKDGYNDSQVTTFEVDWIKICGYAVLDTSTGTLTFKYGPIPEGDNVFDTENTGTIGPWDRSVIKTVIFESSFSAARPTTTEGWFRSSTLLTSISGIENLNTSEVTNMHNMFNGCSILECLDVSHFKTSQVTNMNGMFRECKKLQTLDVSHFDTSNVTNMSYFFYNCNALEALDVSNFNTENVAYMGLVFGGCYKLTELNLTNFNTKNAILMNNMFANCKNLTELDLSSFQTSLVSEMSGMFRKCEKLKTIYVGEGWTTENVIYSNMMFEDCTSLIGGKGFAYDSNYTDMTYARIDGGMSAPGYFTRLLLMGDANDDGLIDMVDVVAMVNYILGTPSESFRTLAADVIPDGEIDVFDVTKLIGMILAKNERPAGLRRAGDSDVARENVLLTAAGNNVYLGVNLPERFTAFQFDVKVPDGCELEDVSRVSHANNHVLKFAKIGENSYSVLGFSMANELFNDVNGRLLELSLSGNAMGEVTISNIQFISPNEERTFFRDETLKVSTGIDVLAVEKDEAIYDLSGQKQNTERELLKKGFYIINGKKKVIK